MFTNHEWPLSDSVRQSPEFPFSGQHSFDAQVEIQFLRCPESTVNKLIPILDWVSWTATMLKLVDFLCGPLCHRDANNTQSNKFCRFSSDGIRFPKPSVRVRFPGGDKMTIHLLCLIQF